MSLMRRQSEDAFEAEEARYGRRAVVQSRFGSLSGEKGSKRFDGDVGEEASNHRLMKIVSAAGLVEVGVAAEAPRDGKKNQSCYGRSTSFFSWREQRFIHFSSPFLFSDFASLLHFFSLLLSRPPDSLSSSSHLPSSFPPILLPPHPPSLTSSSSLPSSYPPSLPFFFPSSRPPPSPLVSSGSPSSRPLSDAAALSRRSERKD